MIPIGQMIGNYQVARLIGRGGMGYVFEAVHLTIGRRAAIKVLSPECSEDPEVASRFLNEARAANLVRHPGLVEIFEFGKLPNGTAYIIMDYLDGESVSAVLHRTGCGLEQARAYDIIRQVAAALAAAHECGIVHRDLKPDNIILVADVERPGHQRVKVLDFGIAKVAALQGLPGSTSHTRPGMALGTPAYMSPEQCLGSVQVDVLADVYSLGIMFYELMSGRRPFVAEHPLDVMTMHVRVQPPPLNIAAMEEGVGLLIEQMLAKVPSDRPSMQQVVQVLARASTSPKLTAASRTETAPYEALSAASTPSQSARAMLAEPLDPFIVGPPITDPRHFFGRQREIKRLFNLWRRIPLQNAAIIGPPRSGKTSLLYYLKNILSSIGLRADQRSDLVSDRTRYRFLFVDFQDPRMGSQEGLLRHILAGLGIPVLSPCSLERFISAMSEQLRSPTIILFDEVSVALQRYRELNTAFWEGLRALAINQVSGNLGFVLSSTHPPHELATQADGGGSPFFNIFGYSATLGPFSEQEARLLVANSPVPFAESDVQWILKQSGGWPILVQILARERLYSLQEEGPEALWQDDALQQLAPFRHLLQRTERRSPEK